MNTPTAIVLAGIIVGAAIIGSQFLGTYQISATQGSNDQPVAWRVNVRTGEAVACYPSRQPSGKFVTKCD